LKRKSPAETPGFLFALCPIVLFALCPFVVLATRKENDLSFVYSPSSATNLLVVSHDRPRTLEVNDKT